MDGTSEGLVSFADGLWLDTAPVRFLGLRLTVTMAVLRLGDGTLLVYSPLILTPERRSAVVSPWDAARKRLRRPKLSTTRIRSGGLIVRPPSGVGHSAHIVEEVATPDTAVSLKTLCEPRAGRDVPA